MRYNITARVQELWQYYDQLLDRRIQRISENAGVPVDHMKKINPAEFIEKNPYQKIERYKYEKIKSFIKREKADGVYLISPLDAVEETAAQISYKDGTNIHTVLRASKCQAVPLPKEVCQDFLKHNHRQTAPVVNGTAVCFGLIYHDEVVAVMMFDRQNGAVRGRNDAYELLRLAIKRGYMIHGGASKLEKECEKALVAKGETQIYSYSNATINSGSVYKALGFTEKRIDGGQPHVIMRSNALVRLIQLYPKSTNWELASRGWIKTFIGGNKMWVKKIQ